MKKTTGDNLGVVGKNTEALLKEMAVKVFNQKQLESACMLATFLYCNKLSSLVATNFQS